MSCEQRAQSDTCESPGLYTPFPVDGFPELLRQAFAQVMVRSEVPGLLLAKSAVTVAADLLSLSQRHHVAPNARARARGWSTQ